MTNDSIRIRIAQPADYVLVSNIGRFTFYETWQPTNSEEDMQLYLSEAFHPEKIKKDLENINNTFLLAYSGNEVVGYSKLRTDRTYDEFKGAPSIEMERIYVTQQFQNMKIGKELMDKCLEIARQGCYEWFWLAVNQYNHKALDFYKLYGFTIFGSKSFKLGNTSDDDYLMKLKIS